MYLSLRRASGLALLFACAVLSLHAQPATTTTSEDVAGDIAAAEQTLAAAGLANDGKALLEFFRQRARMDVDGDGLATLIQQLGDAAPEVRGRAMTALVARGPLAIPLLRKAANDLDDLEFSARARRCLQLIEGPSGAAVTAAAARLIAERKPAGAAKVLLAFLPYADDPTVLEQVGKALGAVAFPDGKADADLVQALQDTVPVRRAFAGEALCRKDHPEQFPAVRKLLLDSRPSVRMKTALALSKEQDPEAIPVLIDLLADMPPAERKPIEDILEEVAGEWAPKIGLSGDDDISRRIRRDVWAGWWKRTDGQVLLEEFKKRTLSAAELAKIQGLINKLGDDTFQVREQAVADLVAYGTMVVPMLREAVKSTELERRMRAERCLRAIAKSEGRSLPSAAPRLLALRQPEGAAEAMLAVLPWTEDENLVAEIHNALATLAIRDPKATKVLLAATEENLTIRRLAAGLALAKGGPAKTRPAVYKLLRDPDLALRIKVAVALATARDKEAIPVLIDALKEIAPEVTEPARDALYQIAGDKAPEAGPGEDAASRKRYSEAWAAWWEANKDSADLSKLTTAPAFLGYTLLAQVNNNNRIGQVSELGRDGKPRWAIGNLNYPMDARMVGNNRVLIVEYDGRRVTERDLKGTVLWTFPPVNSSPLTAQRLRNGNTMVVTQGEIIEVDREKKEVYRLSFQNKGQNLNFAYKLANGEMVCLTNQGRCLRLDPQGKELKSFQYPSGGGVGAADVDVKGRIIAAYNNSSVQAMDADGKVLFTVNSPNATTVSWLPNGNFLVTSFQTTNVIEMNPQGRVVWEHRDTFNHWHARRR
jgi:HEAT repeat protein